MSERLDSLLEQEFFLKELLSQHTKNKHIIWLNREKEFREYIDAILDELNEIREEIRYLQNN